MGMMRPPMMGMMPMMGGKGAMPKAPMMGMMGGKGGQMMPGKGGFPMPMPMGMNQMMRLALRRFSTYSIPILMHIYTYIIYI